VASATEDFVNALGALTGNQAMQQVKAGLKAIYLSRLAGAPPSNVAGEMYPGPVAVSGRTRCRRWSSASTTRCCAPTSCTTPKATTAIDFLQPIVADAEAGFGGILNAFELMKAMIEAGAAGVHFEDQLASVKKCGHMGGKVLVPTREAVEKLVAARLASDVMGFRRSSSRAPTPKPPT
jgi:isocitrate lyase